MKTFLPLIWNTGADLWDHESVKTFLAILEKFSCFHHQFFFFLFRFCTFLRWMETQLFLMLLCRIFRCHNSTGDLKRLDSSLPPSPHSSPAHGNARQQGFRRRASTFSHPPTPTSAEDSPVHPLTRSPQDQTPVAKPKLIRHYSVSTDTPHQSK